MSDRDGVFCDWNAGAPVERVVLERFLTVERECPANPASVHSPGRRSRAVVEAARAQIAGALGVAEDDVVFTSGGTEAANLAVRGLGDPGLPVLLAPVEHAAVLQAAARRGIVEWAVDSAGRAIVAPPAEPVGLVSLVHAQSELGTLQPIDAAHELATSLHVPLFVDAAQTLGRIRLNPLAARADAIALSPHKCGGMRGHGVLIVIDAERLRPLLRGGAQERGLRPGTQSPALAAANALAIELAVNEVDVRSRRMHARRDAFLRGLRASGAAHRVLTPLEDSVPNTVMVTFAGVDGRSLLPMLDLAGIHASHGSACSSGSPAAPPILAAIGVAEADARASVRFSFGWRESTVDYDAVGRRCGEALRTRR